VPEPVKDAVKTVDRKVSDKIVDGIELGRKSPLFCSLPFPYCFLLLQLQLQLKLHLQLPFPFSLNKSWGADAPMQKREHRK